MDRTAKLMGYAERVAALDGRAIDALAWLTAVHGLFRSEIPETEAGCRDLCRLGFARVRFVGGRFYYTPTTDGLLAAVEIQR